MEKNQYAYYSNLRLKTILLNKVRVLFTWSIIERYLSLATRGRSSNHILSKLVPPEYLYKDESWRLCKINGVVYRLDISKKMDHHLFFGFAIPGLTEFMKYISSNDTVLDVGANIGATALLFAQHVAEGHVYCFEPVTKTFNRLQENFNLNTFTNYTLLKKGIGNEKTELLIGSVLESNPAMNRVISNETKAIKTIEKIQISTIDEEVIRLGSKKINAIKIDVEGFEYNVLLGAKITIGKYRPFLFIELGDRNLKEQGASAKDVLLFLEENNYNTFDIRNSKKLLSSDAIDNIHTDILCIP